MNYFCHMFQLFPSASHVIYDDIILPPSTSSVIPSVVQNTEFKPMHSGLQSGALANN